MATKFYVVWQGHTPGIYTSWDEAKRQVDKFPDAKYKSFKTEKEAKAAFAKSPASSIGKKTAVSASAKKDKKTTPKSIGYTSEALAQSDFVFYTDGGCDPNPGKAGSGVAVYRKGELSSLWYGLFNPNGTNNTAELNALHQALLMAAKIADKGLSIQIFCDSQYAINCVSNWAYAWKAKGWTRKGGEIANLELIKQIHTLYDELKDKITLNHVSAHIGIEGNELADRMTMLAVDKEQTDFVKYEDELTVDELLKLRAG